MIDAQAKKILSTVWCENAPSNRQDPEYFGIDPGVGWTVDYEQNKHPERLVFNQILFSLQTIFRAKIVGGILPWMEDVDYPQYAFTKYNGKLYFATQPISKNGMAPDINEQWQVY